jgi:pilus assembly protein CpaB
MNRIRVFMVLVLALCAGGALAYGTYNYMQTATETPVAVATRPVVVAAADLPLGCEIRADDLRVIDWPSTAVPSGAFAQTGDVIGRGLIVPVVQNEPILPAKLAGKDAGAGLPPIIPQGMRALSVRVNEVIGVAGYVLPGTRVDVVATATPTQKREDTTSKVVLSNVQVLAAGTRIEPDAERGQPVSVNVVTLLVTPEEAERLTLASTEGKIQLALRNPLDRAMPETPGVQAAVLLGSRLPVSSARPVAARRPPAAAEEAPTVEIIRGDKRVVEVVK